MITDLLFNAIGGLFKFILNLLPSFDFIDSLINGKNEFINFISEFISYTLYVFNIPILRFTVGLLVGYFTFLAMEYSVKLIIKYVTRLL